MLTLTEPEALATGVFTERLHDTLILALTLLCTSFDRSLRPKAFGR